MTTIPAHLRATYGHCECGARITQYSAKKCIICLAEDRAIESAIERRRFARQVTVHFGHPICLGRQAPRYIDGKEIIE